MSTTCQVPGCERPLSREGFELCYPCWKDRDRLQKAHGVWTRVGNTQAVEDDAELGTDAPGEALSSTKIGKPIGMTNQRIHLVLAELGWIEKFIKGWKVTNQGERVGGANRTSQKGVPYVVWPASILKNRVFLASASEVAVVPRNQAPDAQEKDKSGPTVEDGRLKFPTKYRSQDGHYVRSRAEPAIDIWLYMQGIVHAYARKLPIEADAHCDYNLPDQKVFIGY